MSDKGAVRAGVALPEPPAAATEGPSRYRLLPDRRAQSAEQRSLRRDLSAATSEGRFVLQFQPRMPLRPGRTAAAEAMVRWPHRKRGMMSPASFMPMAEQTGHVVEIGGWALREACREAAAWPGVIGVSVNASRRQVREGLLAGQVGVALAESGLDPERLTLELTEALLLDLDIETIMTLSAIRDLGVGLTADDFGAAHASVATLKRLPLTGMKLDRTLVRGLPDDAEDAAIARGLIGIGHAVGLVVAAEGVETDAQRTCLARAGCDEAQGPLFGHAVTAAQLPRALRAGMDARRSAAICAGCPTSTRTTAPAGASTCCRSSSCSPSAP